MADTKRSVLFKASGEGMAGEIGFGICHIALQKIASGICAGHNQGANNVAVVCGGGNFIRGAVFSKSGCVSRIGGDHMGMLATMLNGIALQECIEQKFSTTETRVMSAVRVTPMTEPFIRRRALRHMQKGRIIICVGGTGNPYFTTDTAAVLRAAELGITEVLKATNVDGVGDKDPNKFPDAKIFKKVGMSQVIRDNLSIMDMTAFTMAKERKINIRVFNMNDSEGLISPDNIARAIIGDDIGTLVYPD